MPLKPHTLRHRYRVTHSRDKKFFSSAAWVAVRVALLSTMPLCAMCGNIATDVDHRQPRSQLPESEWLRLENLQPLCHACHAKKTYRETLGNHA